MIAADDPRHGTYAGALQHWRAGDPACESCLLGARRADKIRELNRLQGRPPMVPLGAHAHSIIVSSPRNQVTAAIGISSHRLIHLERQGPGFLVRRATRDRLLAFQPQWSPIGIQRRLRALAVDGWSLKVLAAETGIHLSSLCKLRRNPDVKFVRRVTAAAVLDAWERLESTPASESHSSRETRAEAASRGWYPAAAWEDIDDPDEDPGATVDSDAVDVVVVQRYLNGDTSLPATTAERREIVARWRDLGRPLRQLELATGWQATRYYDPSDGQVAS